MSYKIIIDSCGELTEEMKKSGNFETASLQIDVGGHHIVDDETFDQADFLKKIRESEECPKSSCPSPERYMEEYHCEAEHIYAVTLSAELSGSYNSAVLGKNLYEEEYGEKDIYVFNSRSASVGETLIGLKIAECEKKGLSFKEVIDTVEEKILAISHCNCRERAETVKNMLLEKAGFKDIIIVDTAGISSMYAADGGVIVVV